MSEPIPQVPYEETGGVWIKLTPDQQRMIAMAVAETGDTIHDFILAGAIRAANSYQPAVGPVVNLGKQDDADVRP